MKDQDRRSFLKSLMVASVAAGTVGTFGRLDDVLAEAKKCAPGDVDPKLKILKGVDLKKPDPEAAPLNYHSIAKKVDTKKFPNKTADQTCKNCQLYLPCKTKKANTGACTLFPGKAVLEKGWCASWIKKA